MGQTKSQGCENLLEGSLYSTIKQKGVASPLLVFAILQETKFRIATMQLRTRCTNWRIMILTSGSFRGVSRGSYPVGWKHCRLGFTQLPLNAKHETPIESSYKHTSHCETHDLMLNAVQSW